MAHNYIRGPGMTRAVAPPSHVGKAKIATTGKGLRYKNAGVQPRERRGRGKQTGPTRPNSSTGR